MSNQLQHENSPYLLQHANNPVNWHPWGDIALNLAIKEDKPIFLSIGYAACHWCHVMAHESFEDPSIAAFMNDHFINIKVDREERPDLDSIYMSATVAMTGSGGWPMSVFLTPDLQPFYAGTYFPPTPRFNLPSFQGLLEGIAHAWQNQRDEIFRVGVQVTAHISEEYNVSNGQKMKVNLAFLTTAVENLLNNYDWSFGGWGDAPKFPQPMAIEFLLNYATSHNFDPQSKEGKISETAKKTVSHVLKAMIKGGMYDILGGGFSRYSVDNQWKTPHFEKMLYDNAQLSQAYLHAYLLTGEPDFLRTCNDTFDFVLREMSNPLGGFYSSLDADSEGKEGKFYTWTRQELVEILGNDFDLFSYAYDLSENPEGTINNTGIILSRGPNNQELANRLKITIAKVESQLSKCHAKLLKYRNKRIKPNTDDKILTSWNALMSTVLAEAGRFLNRSDYLEAAIKNVNFLLENIVVNDRILRSWREGKVLHTAALEDYAAITSALLSIYQSDPKEHWYKLALKFADDMVNYYSDPQGGFFDTPNDHEAILLRPKNLQDNATPSGNSLAAHAILQLSEFGDRPSYKARSEEMLSSVLKMAVRYPTAYSKWLCAISLLLSRVRQVAIIGEFHKPETKSLIGSVWRAYRPDLIFAFSEQPLESGYPAILINRPVINNQPTAYVCEGFVCLKPVNSPEDLLSQLGRIAQH